MPHSRHTEVRREDIAKVKELTILSEADGDAGVYAIANLAKRQFFITGHAEYDPLTLKGEYDRDVKAGMEIQIPQNYYPGDDPKQPPVVKWRSVANLLFANWLNYGLVGGVFALEFMVRKRRFPGRYKNAADFFRRCASLGPAFWRDLFK